jgi:hypothetical protein
MDNGAAVEFRASRPESDHEHCIADDLACGGCGYNLRGRAPSDTCPECGMSVARSARHDLLRYADRAWLRGIAIGLVLFMMCAALALVFKVSYAVALNRYVNAGTLNQSMTWATRLTWFSLVANVLMQGLTIMGAWLITRAEPGRERDMQALRRTARICILVSFGLMAIVWVPWLNYIINGRYLYGGVVIYVAQVAGGVLSCVAVVALFIMARRLALRIPDEQLARRTVIAALGITGIMVFEGIYSWTNFFGLFFTITGEASRYIVHLPQAIVTAWAIALLMQYRGRILAA